MFRTRPMRTWLTILGISVGISTVVFLVSLGYGLQKIILERIVFSQALLSLSVTPSSDVINLTDENINAMKSLPNVTDSAPMAMLKGQAIMGEVNGTVDVRAADAPYFDYAGVAAENGDLYKPDDTHKAVVSEAVLRLFGAPDSRSIIGKQVHIRILNPTSEATSTVTTLDLPDMYTIVGVVRDPQDSYIYIPLSELRGQMTINQYHQVELKVADSKNLAAVKDDVIAKGFQVASLQETIDQANKIFQVFQVILGLFGAVALIVSAIGMFNTMTVTLLERTNEIGIMRALGAGEGAIKSMFLTESVILGFLGGLLGIALGFAGGQGFNSIINNLAVRFGGAKASLFYYPQWFLIAVILISVTIGFFSGVFPSSRASKMDPLEALRYK